MISRRAWRRSSRVTAGSTRTRRTPGSASGSTTLLCARWRTSTPALAPMRAATESRCATTMMTSEGQILPNRFHLLRQLGEGGMGSVWLGEDQRLERAEALKELVPHRRGLDRDESRARALVQARAMAREQHPAIGR